MKRKFNEFWAKNTSKDLSRELIIVSREKSHELSKKIIDSTRVSDLHDEELRIENVILALKHFA